MLSHHDLCRFPDQRSAATMPQLVKYFQHSTEAYFGMGIEGTTALDAWGNWNPGL